MKKILFCFCLFFSVSVVAAVCEIADTELCDNASQGDAKAQFKMGLLYKTGDGIQKDYGEAKKWFEKSSEQGVAEASLMLGLMYSFGEGVEQDNKKSTEWYEKAADHAAQQGIIIADTKFEFGVVDGKVILADEVLTPDSSRFWAAATYREGEVQPSFDKQFVRNWLNANWDRSGNPPHLPEDVIQKTSEKYIQAYELITGTSFQK